MNATPPNTALSSAAIDEYVRRINRETAAILTSRSQNIRPYPLSYGQFCNLLSAHAAKIMAQRGESGKFSVDAGNEHLLQALYLYFTRSDRFRGDLSKGILLTGSYGTGKTLVLKALAEVNGTVAGHFASQGAAVPRMILVKSSRIDSLSAQTAAVPPIYVIDELGRENKEVVDYGNVRHPVASFLERQYDAGNTVFATSNFRLETLATPEFYGKMIGDRMRQMFNVIELTGESRRK